MVCILCIHNSPRICCKGGIVRIHTHTGMTYPIQCIKFDSIYNHCDFVGGAELGL